jgi:Holliday junction resolvase RusA-like endonuclease
MLTHTLTFDIEPIGKGRAKSGNGHHYTPERTRVYEDSLRVLAKEQFCVEPLTGALWVEGFFYFPTKVKKRWGMYYANKPDADNTEKAVWDALKGIVWKDDCLIADHHTVKKWAEHGGIVLSVRQLYPDTILVSGQVANRIDKVLGKAEVTEEDVISAEDYLRRLRGTFRGT